MLYVYSTAHFCVPVCFGQLDQTKMHLQREISTKASHPSFS